MLSVVLEKQSVEVSVLNAHSAHPPIPILVGWSDFWTKVKRNIIAGGRIIV